LYIEENPPEIQKFNKKVGRAHELDRTCVQALRFNHLKNGIVSKRFGDPIFLGSFQPGLRWAARSDMDFGEGWTEQGLL
jgi:hypothetical protein